MKHLIVSATALTLLAGSAFAQESTTTNPPPAAPAQTAPNQTQTQPPAELAPNSGNSTGENNQSGGANDTDAQSSSRTDDQLDNGDSEAREGAMDRREMRGDRGRDRWERHHQRRHHWRGGPRHARGNEGAHFRLTTKEDGEVELDVRCAGNEPMQVCADIVNGMLDRLNNNDTGSDDRSDL
jgi:hypothetical protein